MRWKPKVNEEPKWHLWFAWYPVGLSDTGEIAWLERVWRMQVHDSGYGTSYEYESYMGEKRELGPERLMPTKEEIHSKNKAIQEVMIYTKKEPEVLKAKEAP